MNVQIIEVGAFDVNCLLLHADASRAWVVDPGFEPERIDSALTAARLRPAAYLLTHGHVDHVTALAHLQRVHPAPAYIHEDDATWAFTRGNSLPPFYDAPPAPPEPLRIIRHDDRVTAADMTFQVIHTPGHSPGSVCFYAEEHRLLLAGDTLFHESIGRSDLPGGNPRALQESLERLLRLPDDTRVYPGHGPPTTMGHEKRENPFCGIENASRILSNRM